MLKSFKFWITILIVIFIGFLFKESFTQENATFESRAIKPPISNYTAVAKGKIDVDGGIIEVSARLGGTFRKVYVQEGDIVEARDVLAVQEDNEEQIALKSVNAQLMSAKATMNSLLLRKKIAQREYDRLKPLLTIDASSQLDLDRAMDDIDQITLDIELQEAAILRAQASVESAQFKLEQRTIRAPVAGRIIEAKARPGMGASTLNISAAFTLMPNTQKIVRADLDQNFVGAVKVGDKAIISPDANPETQYQGEVLRVGEIFGRKTTNDSSSMRGGSNNDYVIEIVVAAGKIPLLIGQQVLVRFPIKTTDNAAENN